MLRWWALIVVLLLMILFYSHVDRCRRRFLDFALVALLICFDRLSCFLCCSVGLWCLGACESQQGDPSDVDGAGGAETDLPDV